MNGNTLTLSLVGALALAGAVRRRGSPMRADQHTLQAAQLHAKIDQIEAMRAPRTSPQGSRMSHGEAPVARAAT